MKTVGISQKLQSDTPLFTLWSTRLHPADHLFLGITKDEKAKRRGERETEFFSRRHHQTGSETEKPVEQVWCVIPPSHPQLL